MEGKCMEKKTLDPSVTIHVNNDELEQLIAAYTSNKNAETFNRVITKLVTCRLLLPGTMNSNTKTPSPYLLKAGETDMYLPIFTSLKHVQKAPKSQAILNMPYMHTNAMVLNAKEDVKGIVINPFTDNILLKKDLLQNIAGIEEMKQKGMGQLKLTGEQYLVFERMNFERRFLPKRLFDEGQGFFERLEERKEAFLDELYEESYQQKRMYPYLEEDFSVMLLTISEELKVARIEFPTKDMAPGVAIRGFLSWNPKNAVGHYFLIEQGKEPDTKIFSEITRELKYVSYGQAPVDGMELQRVLDLVQTSQGMTS